MSDFFSDIEFEAAERIELLSRLMFEMRSSRQQLCRRYGVDDAAMLLEKIRSGDVAEHPAYEHYLSMLILEEQRRAAREELQAYLPGVRRE